MTYMPLMGTGLAIRMELLSEEQAKINHGQTLQTLAGRGGLGLSEALALVKRHKWQEYGFDEALKALLAVVPKL